MTEKEKFEQEFETEEREMLFLVSESCMGAFCMGEYRRPSVRFIASVDCDTNTLSKKEGSLCWIIKADKDRRGFGFEFEDYEIYKVKVRKCIEKELDRGQAESFNNRYMLIEILEKNLSHSELDPLKEYYKKPIVINNELGEFVLNRQFSEFNTTMYWTEDDINVALNTDEYNGETANKAMEVLLKIAKDKEDFDNKTKEYAVSQLLDLANDWNEDEENDITKESFLDAIFMSDIIISSDGELTVYYYDGDIFYGHTIEVRINSNLEYVSANIAG